MQRSMYLKRRVALFTGSFLMILVALGLLWYLSPRPVIVYNTTGVFAKDALASTTSAVDSASATAVSPLYRLVVPKTPIDPSVYAAKSLAIANLPPAPVVSSTTASTTPAKKILWPVTSAPTPLPGALLPFNRLIAYYGNLYSKQMGVLGKYPEDEMLARLASTTAAWNAADPSTRAIPVLDYIAVVAQAGAGADGMYRARMPGSEIERVINLAAQINGAVILDIQVGLSTVQKEVPLLEEYLKLPQVHLALDPEFAMPNGEKPGTVIGTLDAKDVNDVAEYLAKIVRDNDLPPKVLIVHRFTKPMLTNATSIKPLPEVQIVVDMDGFGTPAKKLGTYSQVVVPEPVQFTGFKLFYKNDAVAGHLMEPEEVLELSPQPVFIQYQ